MENIYLLTLGCPRNLVDSEVLLGLLDKEGFSSVDTPEESGIAIVNTCAFIQDAKEESIDAILQLAELKKEGKIKRIFVMGCLSQRYPDELMSQIHEVDGVFGSGDFTAIPEMLRSLGPGEKIRKISAVPGLLCDHTYERSMLTPRHYAYVKIQEGCSNRCSYCVIPDLKGPRRSRSMDSVISEIETLKNSGIKELILIGQDTTSFGMDTAGKSLLPRLLEEASDIMGDGWVRLLYTYPAHFTDDLLNVLRDRKNICRYVDIPIQHINDRILKKMNRYPRKKEVKELIERIRRAIPDVVLRSSVIVGFPGETDEEFEELAAFLEDIRFDRLGAFIYSREEGTPAAAFRGQVHEDKKKDRLDRVMRLQQEISAENNERLIGKKLKVLIDDQVPGVREEYEGRSQMDAPEVDGVIYVRGGRCSPGEMADIKVTGSMEYDLIGEPV